jgi:hypothetical protein
MARLSESVQILPQAVAEQLKRISAVMPAAGSVLRIGEQAQRVHKGLQATRMAGPIESVLPGTSQFSEIVRRGNISVAPREIPTLVQPARARLMDASQEWVAQTYKPGTADIEGEVGSLARMMQQRRAAATQAWAARA